jgi:hypothetical protein
MKTFIKFRKYFGADKRYGIAVIEDNKVHEFLSETAFAEKYPAEKVKGSSAFLFILEEVHGETIFIELFNQFYYKDRDIGTYPSEDELDEHKFF